MNPSPLEAAEARLAAIHTQLAEIDARNAGAGLPPADARRWHALAQEAEEALADVHRERARAQLAEHANDPRRTASGDGARDFQHQRRVETMDAARALSAGASEVRDAALAAIDRSGVDADAAGTIERLLNRDADDNFAPDYIARRTAITESPAYRSAFSRVLVEQHPILTGPESEALRAFGALERTMNITTAGAGGYGVPVLIDPTIMLTDQGSTNPFWSIADVKLITTKDWRGVSAAGVTFAFETESATANDLTPTLAQPIIHAHKLQGAIPYTIEVGMDYPDFASELTSVLASGYDDLLLNKFTLGSGTGEPWGIFEACENATCQVAVGTDAQLHASDIRNLWTQLPQRARARATWMMSADVWQEVVALGDDKLANQTQSLATGTFGPLMGRPVAESAYAPSFTGTTGAASIAMVGDFKSFKIAVRAGMNVETVQHLVDTTTGLPTGQRALFAWGRVGSDSVIDADFRMLVNT